MWLVDTIVVLIGVILGHAGIRRLWAAGNSVVQFVGLCLIGAITLTAIAWIHGQNSLEILAALALLTVGCELYLFLFTFAISSVSMALLLEKSGHVSLAPQPTMPTESQMPATRVARMIESGLVTRTADGRPHPTAKGRIILGVRRALRTFFNHE